MFGAITRLRCLRFGRRRWVGGAGPVHRLNHLEANFLDMSRFSVSLYACALLPIGLPLKALRGQETWVCQRTASPSAIVWERGREAGVVLGRVVNNRWRTLEQAQVMLLPDTANATGSTSPRSLPLPVPVAVSDTTGKFRIQDVALGRYTLRVRAIGYRSVVAPIFVTETGVEVAAVLSLDLSHDSACIPIRPPPG